MFMQAFCCMKLQMYGCRESVMKLKVGDAVEEGVMLFRREW